GRAGHRAFGAAQRAGVPGPQGEAQGGRATKVRAKATNERWARGPGRGRAVEIVTKKHLMIYTGTAHPDLAHEIAGELGIPISEWLVADLRTAAGADRAVSVDLHSGQLQGFFDFPVDHLTALPLLSDHFQQDLGLGEDAVVVAPDAGRVKVAERLRDHLHSD